MNWTGGRLQRHSYKSHRSLKVTQKQYFAKARLKAQKSLHQGPSSSSARSSWSQNLPTTQLSHQQTRKKTDSHEECERRVNQTIPSDRSSKRSLETGESQYFEELRRKLLKRQDWASLSIARPLRTSTFPRRDRHTINIAKRQHRRPQKMKDRITFHEDYVDADIAIGEVIDLPRGYIDQNGLDAVLPGFPNMKRGDIYDEMCQSPSTIGSNSPSDLEYLRLEEGFETDLETTRMANSRNIDPGERSYRANVLWEIPDHREGPEAESSAVFGEGASKWFSSSNCRNRNSSIPPRSMDIQHHNTRLDSPNDELQPDYWSVAGSESPNPSQDQSESMLLDIEEMDGFMSSGMDLRNNDISNRPGTTHSNGNKDEKRYGGEHRSPLVLNNQRESVTLTRSTANRSPSTMVSPRNLNIAEGVALRPQRYPGEGSAGAVNRVNPAPTSTNDPPLPPAAMQAMYYMHPERFPDNSLRYLVPNPYAAHELPTGPNASSTSDPDISDDQPVLGFRRRETSSIVSHSAMEQNMSASLELQDYSSSPYRGKSIEQHPSTQAEIHDQEQCYPRQQETLDVDNVARPEIPVPTSEAIDNINALAGLDDGGDHLWKSFMVWPTSQEPSNHYTLLPPVRVEGSDLDAADGPAYPNSLTEPNNESNEAVSHVEGTEAMTVCDSADLSEARGSDSLGCEISSQNAVVSTTHDSSVSAQDTNVSEFNGTLNETPIFQETDKDDAISDVQPAETEGIRTANHRFMWSNQRQHQHPVSLSGLR
ncbi:hypothetical protein BDBG_06610 [Blastomyces gilchristii SLH14081]|uniref:Uncharacterized protein n=1 Tax=Blastomyces gilchristii (strain SLH14081) TaxID=559298 RepID=A0A179UUU5_BLAGS|nr:uncharacterized protein BDBG_06610 [Blastomyces gilchristii SLH14081]OAT10821.1 hypothetical protein BDBG_06610 [Blastomyces gilchristii SLH14081]